MLLIGQEDHEYADRQCLGGCVEKFAQQCVPDLHKGVSRVRCKENKVRGYVYDRLTKLLVFMDKLLKLR